MNNKLLITELTSVKKQVGAYQYHELLANYGFDQVGRGSFSKIYKHPELPYVLKVFSADLGYMKFLEFCKSHKDNPHLPKFRGKFIRLHNDTFALRMEKLLPNSYVDTYPEPFSDLQYKLTNLRNSRGSSIELKNMLPRELQPIFKSNPELLQTMVDLIEFRRNNDLKFDIHAGNFMIRPSDKKWIIIDPFVY